MDVVAILTAHWVAAGLALAAASALVRDRWAIAIALCSVVVGTVGVTRGRSFTLDAPGADAPTLRVLVFNGYARNEDRAAQLELIERSEPDIVVLSEAEIGLSRAIRWDGALAGTHPHILFRDWEKDRVSPIIVASRLEIEAGEPGDMGYALSGVIEFDGGPVAIAAGQPRSPRSASRWRQGNEETLAHARRIEALRAQRLPVVFCADLNSTPAGHRGSIVRAAGVRPAKPLVRPAGTFPSWSPWPARIAIDDAWVSPELRVVSWETVGPAGSDHLGVLVGVQRVEPER